MLLKEVTETLEEKYKEILGLEEVLKTWFVFTKLHNFSPNEISTNKLNTHK